MRRRLIYGLTAVVLVGALAGCGWMRRVLRLKPRKAEIKNVPAMDVGRGWDSMLRGMQILLKHRGQEATLNELMVYGYTKTRGDTKMYGAPEGCHDDCVTALALAAWQINRPKGFWI